VKFYFSPLETKKQPFCWIFQNPGGPRPPWSGGNYWAIYDFRQWHRKNKI